MNSTKHLQYHPLRYFLKDFTLLDGGLFFSKNLLLFFLLLLSISTKAQFFVGKQTTIYIENKETLYIESSSTSILSEIQNKGTLILHHNNTIETYHNRYEQAITFNDAANLRIKKISLAKNKVLKPKAESKTQKKADFFPSKNTPYEKGAMYSAEQTAIASPSTSPKFKKNTELTYIQPYNFELFCLKDSTIPAKQNNNSGFFKQNKIGLKNNSRPPPIRAFSFKIFGHRLHRLTPIFVIEIKLS